MAQSKKNILNLTENPNYFVLQQPPVAQNRNFAGRRMPLRQAPEADGSWVATGHTLGNLHSFVQRQLTWAATPMFQMSYQSNSDKSKARVGHRVASAIRMVNLMLSWAVSPKWKTKANLQFPPLRSRNPSCPMSDCIWTMEECPRQTEGWCSALCFSCMKLSTVFVPRA